MAAQMAAHEAYLRALDRLRDVEDSGDRRVRGRIPHEVGQARRRWHRLVGASDEPTQGPEDRPASRA